MKVMTLAVLVLWVGALSPHAARATVSSGSGAAVHWQDYPAELDAQNSDTLTSSASIVGTQTFNGDPTTTTIGSAASAHTGPGTMGVAASISVAGQQSSAGAETADAWLAGSPVGSDTSMGLRIQFSGTLDPWMVDGSLPVELADMRVTVRYVIDPDGVLSDYDDGGFTYSQIYIPYDIGGGQYAALMDTSASFVMPGSDTPEDATPYLVFSGNTVSFDHTFDWIAPSGSFSDLFQAEARIDAQTGSLQSPHAIDFLSTFHADPISNDPNVVFYSEGGRTTIPEPSDSLLLGAGLAIVGVWRRGSRRCP